MMIPPRGSVVATLDSRMKRRPAERWQTARARHRSPGRTRTATIGESRIRRGISITRTTSMFNAGSSKSRAEDNMTEHIGIDSRAATTSLICCEARQRIHCASGQQMLTDRDSGPGPTALWVNETPAASARGGISPIRITIRRCRSIHCAAPIVQNSFRSFDRPTMIQWGRYALNSPRNTAPELPFRESGN